MFYFAANLKSKIWLIILIYSMTFNGARSRQSRALSSLSRVRVRARRAFWLFASRIWLKAGSRRGKYWRWRLRTKRRGKWKTAFQKSSATRRNGFGRVLFTLFLLGYWGGRRRRLVTRPTSRFTIPTTRKASWKTSSKNWIWVKIPTTKMRFWRAFRPPNRTWFHRRLTAKMRNWWRKTSKRNARLYTVYIMSTWRAAKGRGRWILTICCINSTFCSITIRMWRINTVNASNMWWSMSFKTPIICNIRLCGSWSFIQIVRKMCALWATMLSQFMRFAARRLTIFWILKRILSISKPSS